MPVTETAADSGTVIAHWLTTATGETSAIVAKGSRLVDVCIDFNSTTANVVDLEGEFRAKIASDPGDADWKVIESYTTDTVKVVRVAAARKLRLNCSTHGETGTIAAELTSGNKE